MSSVFRSESNIIGRSGSVVLRTNGAPPSIELMSVLCNALATTIGRTPDDQWIALSDDDEKIIDSHNIEIGQGMAILVIDSEPRLHSEYLLNQTRHEFGIDRTSVFFSGFVWKRAEHITDILTQDINKRNA